MRRPAALRLAFSMVSEARRSAVPLACVILPATASPCRFSSGVAHIAKLGLPSGCLAIKPAVRVAGTRMGVVLALLAMEVGAVIIVAAAVLGAKTLLRSPGFDQRSVHRKMLVRQ